MGTFLLVVALLAAAIHLVRQFSANRGWPTPPTTAFSGELHEVGATTIAVQRPSGEATRTVICMPGFLEDMRYFVALYQDRGDELILVNNANYHCPFDGTPGPALDWDRNPHPAGSIAHDGFLLAQTVRHLASSDDIVLHGHSRGGAVVLDAARQFPSVMKPETGRVRAILEAPVLPQGTPAGRPAGPIAKALTLYLMPIFLAASRNMSTARLNGLPMMRPTNELKTRLCKTIFSNPKTYATAVANVRDIGDWQKNQPHDLYENYEGLTVLIGERDDVLDTRTMRVSAEAGRTRNAGVRIVETTQTNHFISLETPAVILHEIDTTAQPRRPSK